MKNLVFSGRYKISALLQLFQLKNRKKGRDMKTSFSKGAKNDSVIIREREIQFFLTALLILLSHLFSAGTPKADGNDQIWNLVGG